MCRYCFSATARMANSTSSIGALMAISGGSTRNSTPPGGCVTARPDLPRLAMEIADLITPRSVVAQLRAANKKQALLELAKRAAAMTGIQERMIYDVLIERERLGSTGIGMGIGIPHGRLPGLGTLC